MSARAAGGRGRSPQPRPAPPPAPTSGRQLAQLGELPGPRFCCAGKASVSSVPLAPPTARPAHRPAHRIPSPRSSAPWPTLTASHREWPPGCVAGGGAGVREELRGGVKGKGTVGGGGCGLCCVGASLPRPQGRPVPSLWSPQPAGLRVNAAPRALLFITFAPVSLALPHDSIREKSDRRRYCFYY